MVMSPAGLGSQKEWAGEDQQQLQSTSPYSRLRGCYVRTVITRVQLKKKDWRQDELISGKPPVAK
jgi:hypothetical protein